MASIRVGPFRFVLEDSASRRVDANLLGDRTALDVERVAKPAAAALAFQLFSGDSAGMSFQGDGSRLFDIDPCFAGGSTIAATRTGWGEGVSSRRNGSDVRVPAARASRGRIVREVS